MNRAEKKTGANGGFTLIEMLVVLAIIIIITGIVIFNVGSERANAALERSAQNLSLDLRRVENYALSAKEFKNSGAPCGWGIHFNGAGSTSYIIFADTASSPDCSNRDFKRAADGSEDFETVNLDGGIQIGVLSAGLSDVVFSPPEPSVVFTPSQTSAFVTLTNKDYLTKSIIVNQAGYISSP